MPGAQGQAATAGLAGYGRSSKPRIRRTEGPKFDRTNSNTTSTTNNNIYIYIYTYIYIYIYTYTFP